MLWEEGTSGRQAPCEEADVGKHDNDAAQLAEKEEEQTPMRGIAQHPHDLITGKEGGEPCLRRAPSYPSPPIFLPPPPAFSIMPDGYLCIQ